MLFLYNIFITLCHCTLSFDPRALPLVPFFLPNSAPLFFCQVDAWMGGWMEGQIDGCRGGWVSHPPTGPFSP